MVTDITVPKDKYIKDNYDRIFVVGDIHGCLDELKQLYKHLLNELSFSNSDLLIFVGDYIDRGPSSKGVIDFLLEIRSAFPQTIFLKGNHEDMFLSFLGFEGFGGNFYMVNGGIETLDSYGLTTFEHLKNAPGELPREHLDFLLGLDRLVVLDRFVVVHAGLNPLRNLTAQVNEDVFWIRDEFIHNIHYFDKIVVFGHTPYQNLFFDLPFKIGIDTGLVYGNWLSCVEIKSGLVLQVPKGEAVVRQSVFADHGVNLEDYKRFSESKADQRVASASEEENKIDSLDFGDTKDGDWK